MINFKLGKIKLSHDSTKNNRDNPPKADFSGLDNKPHLTDTLKNVTGEFDTIESLKEDCMRLQNKIKKMDEIIEELKSHLYINID